MSEKLKQVAALIYLSLGLGIPNMILASKYNSSVSMGVPEAIFALVIMGLMAGLAYQIGKGKNWAIWTYTVLSILGVLSIGQVGDAFKGNFFYGLLSLSQFGVQYFALYLIHEQKIKTILGLDGGNTTQQSTVDNVTAIKIPTALNTQGNPRPNVSSDLSKLHELLKSGALTQEEFDAEKKKILNRAA